MLLVGCSGFGLSCVSVMSSIKSSGAGSGRVWEGGEVVHGGSAFEHGVERQCFAGTVLVYDDVLATGT